MESSSQQKSRKRTNSLSVSEQASNAQHAPGHRPHRDVLESKRTRVAVEEISDSRSIDESLDSVVSERQPAAPRGHNYGPASVRDNGTLQNGDNFYQTGPASQIFGPSILNGDMTIQLSNAFYSCNRNLPRHSPEDDQERALKSLLYYTTMDDRKAQLARVQPASLEWVWKTQLPSWLTNGENIFWISGKPASGKSTLMHHLSVDRYGSEQVLKHLQIHKKSWILVHFYFDFRAGEGIANTGLGMLRSLLLQLIDISPEIEGHVLSRCKHRLDGRWPELEPELLDLICGAVSSTAVSICGFVDGLDEYKGHLGKLIGLLRELHERSSIKLCLASRPEAELRYHLHECPSFAMQDHNHGTIAAYIEAATADVNKIVHVQQLQDILTEVVMHNANGVILWAVFAIDEAVKALLCGCTLAEVRKRLQLFPRELFAVYQRIWDCLTAEDQQLAAVMFFVIEIWDPSFDRVVGKIDLSSRHFTVVTRSIVRKLDPSFEAEPDYTELNFRLKTHALLSGLIEGLGDANNVRLAHKSVQSFLRQLPVYVEWTGKISQVVDVDVLGPAAFVDATLAVCDAIIPQPASFWRAVKQDLPDKPLLHHFLNYLTHHLGNLSRNRPVDCVIETFQCVWEYVAYAASDGFDIRQPSHFRVLDQPSLTHLVVSVSETWLIKDYIVPYHLYISKESYPVYFPRYKAFEALEQTFPAMIPVQKSRIEMSGHLNDHPELLYLARYSLSHAFIAIATTGGGLTRADCDLLFSVILRGWHTGSPREMEARKRILFKVLEQLPWQARLLTALSLPVFIGVLDLLEGSERRADFILRPSLWWPSEEIHVLCLWAWTDAWDINFKELAILDALISAGVLLEHDVFEEGNVLHALFKYNPWSQSGKSWPSSRHPLDCILPVSDLQWCHFSGCKFLSLVSRGANIHARGLHGTVRQAAEQFIVSMEDLGDRYLSWKSTLSDLRRAIAYIDSKSESDATDGDRGSVDHTIISEDEADDDDDDDDDDDVES